MCVCGGGGVYVSMRYWEDINRWGVWGDKPLWGGGSHFHPHRKMPAARRATDTAFGMMAVGPCMTG